MNDEVIFIKKPSYKLYVGRLFLFGICIAAINSGSTAYFVLTRTFNISSILMTIIENIAY
jgi:hypothetical protein